MNQLSFDFMENYIEKGFKLNKLGKLKTKKCSKCKKEFEATTENFCKNIRNKDGFNCYCKTCDKKMSFEHIKKSKENNQCLKCGLPKLSNSNYCLFHYVYSIIHTQKSHGRFTHLKTKEQKQAYAAVLIQKLETQKYKCAITGVDLIPGFNLSLDHIIDISKGGTCGLENLQWVSKTANFSKPRK